MMVFIGSTINEWFLIVDVNVVISSLYGKGDSFRVFFANRLLGKFDFFAPSYLLEELNQHLDEIIEKSGLSIEVVKNDLDFVMGKITFIPEEEYDEYFEEARRILKDHEKDAPYLALALKLNCNIFSGDKTFKRLCPDRVKTPKEILEKFYK